MLKKISKSELVLLVLTLITIIPLFIEPGIYGDDLGFHLLRLEDIKNGLLTGAFPVYIMPESLNGYGYANGIFYPDLLMYFPAILRILGINLRIAYAIFMSLCTIAATASMYICVLKIFKSRNISFYATVLYILAEYKIADLYLRSAVGEYISFIFIPIILLGIYELLYRDYKKYYILAIGMSGVLLSHLLSVVIITLMCILAYMLNWKSLIKEPKRLLNSIKAALITMLITAYSWMPILGQFIYDDYRVGKNIEEASKWAIKISDIYGIERPARFFMGFIILGFFLYTLVIAIKRDNKFVNMIFLLGLFFTFLTLKIEFTKRFFDIFEFLNCMQFSWRLGVIITPILVIIFAYSIDVLFEEKNKKVITIIVVSFLVLNIFAFKEFYRVSDIDFNNYSSKYSNDIGYGQEYLPKGATLEKVFERDKIVKSKEESFKYSDYKKEGSTIRFNFNTSKENTEVELPLLYYYGYTYKIISNSGEIISDGNAKHSDDMFVYINLGKEKEGKLIVEYTGTIFMKIGNAISIITIIFIGFILIREKRLIH